MEEFLKNIIFKILEIIFEPISASLLIALSFIGAWIFNKVLPIFIKARVSRHIEFLKRDLLRKEKTESVIHCVQLLKKQKFNELSDEEKDELDRVFLTLSLHLPPCLVHKLAHTACQTGTTEDLQPLGLLVEVRKFIDGKYKADKKRTLTADNIPQTTREEEENAKRMYQYVAELRKIG